MKNPLTSKLLLIVDEAVEINPPDKVERLATNKVEEALSTPLTWSELEIVEDAELINPPTKDERLSACKVE